jgi:plasmid stability protein
MRTTVDLPESLIQEAKLRAARRHTTVSAVIEDALRAAFARDAAAAETIAIRLTTDPGGGGLPGVSLDENSSLLDVMEDGE